MTIAEIQRYIEGAIWRMKSQAQFDYSLANLIGISVGRTMAPDLKFPSIEEVYPDLFQDEKDNLPSEEEIKMENSKNRFLEFAMKHNARIQKGELNDD